MTTAVEAETNNLVAALRLPVWNTLAARADTIRRSLPPRPDSAGERYAWLRDLTPEQARRASLLDHLEALCSHLSGRPALGYAPDDPLPDEALQEAEGFNPSLTRLIARYRQTQAAACPAPPPHVSADIPADVS
ncbi:hypothetical protein [Streptomyces fructofermentans]|uniref:Uncharacterized protein n=1 Tax=Streptomyces fructofermentans TaxID=152141 RepID=A0A918NMA2_9ACTN|nr:hypothetical protein [Streptomyces fructofermentans]GGX80362.1 hypothetical protein GCM10010515_55070 [Streptomyces fructofermentans]